MNQKKSPSLSAKILAEARETLDNWEKEEQALMQPQKTKPRREKSGQPRRPEPAPKNRPQKSRENHGVPVEKGSKGRTPCPLAHKCGGCQLQNLSYKEQLAWKQRKVEKLLKKFGKVSPIIGMDDPWHYRNKVQAAFGVQRGGRIVSGVYQSSTHRIVPVDSCLIEDKKADEIIVTIRNLMKSFKLTAYDEYHEEGILRHVLVKRGFATNQIMVVLVTSGPIFPSKRNFVGALLKKHPDITTVIQNINPYRTSLVLGERENVLYGSGYIEDILCGMRFRISSRSFYQINPVQTQVLYGKAVELAALTGKETVIDAYCGIGTIGLIASRSAGQVVGAELNPEAVTDAVANAQLNQAENIRFVAADAGEFMAEMANAGQKADVVFMDPPRAGSDQAFLSSLVQLMPERIVYISCNPETQARDLAYLTKQGYRVQAIQPVDMFPHTNHVETVVLLSHKKADSYIHIDVEFGEGEGKIPVDKIVQRAEKYKPKERVTYKRIKEYVLEKYGFKVHTAYIAEVKRSLGLPMYDAPNAVEELKQPRKHPTPEKIEAIKDALHYFAVI